MVAEPALGDALHHLLGALQPGPGGDGCLRALAPWSLGGLPNFRGASSAGRLTGIWDEDTLARLLVQLRHDPAGLSRRAGSTVT